MMKRLGLGLVAGVVLGALAAPASADTITAIELSAYYGGANGTFSGDWSGEVNGSSIITAPISGNQNTGITFADWSGHYVAVPSATMNSGSNTLTINNFSPIALAAGATVQSLWNEGWGLTPNSADNNAAVLVTFTNSAGDSATYCLQSGQTIRDYNNGSYYNSFSGSNTTTALGDVTAQNWWANTGGQRLDEQSFVLPSSWAGTSLTGFTIDVVGAGNGPSNDGVAMLSAVNVADPPASVPEPASLTLLAAGVIGLGAARRRRG